MCASPCTVGPQTYIDALPASRGSKGRSVRVRVSYRVRAIGAPPGVGRWAGRGPQGGTVVRGPGRRSVSLPARADQEADGQAHDTLTPPHRPEVVGRGEGHRHGADIEVAQVGDAGPHRLAVGAEPGPL